MALTPARWLVDKSVLARVDVTAVADAVVPRVQAGHVGVALVTELEVGYAARSAPDYAATRQDLLDLLIPVTMPIRAEERARELQRDLVTRGQHRGVSVPDLVLAAIADIDRRCHRTARRVGRATRQHRLTWGPPQARSNLHRSPGSCRFASPVAAGTHEEHTTQVRR